MVIRSFKSRGMGLVALAGVAGLAATVIGADRGGGTGSSTPVVSGGSQQSDEQSMPETITLTGIVRDFRERSVTSGHTDFERNPSAGFGLFQGIVADTLDADGKPQHASSGRKVTGRYKDAQNREMIAPKSYIAARTGDVTGSMSTSSGDQVASAESLAQWYRDVPGVNSARTLDLVLTRQPGTSIYTFNDRTSPTYSQRGGFFPINGELFGNSAGNDRNFHFTYELHTNFVYKRGTGQVFSFTGDDDVWVYVNGKLVIDLGGIHAAESQTIDLDRMTGLEDNSVCSLDFFFAERHRTQSNFRIDTTLLLRRVEPPATRGMFD